MPTDPNFGNSLYGEALQKAREDARERGIEIARQATDADTAVSPTQQVRARIASVAHRLRMEANHLEALSRSLPMEIEPHAAVMMLQLLEDRK